MSSFMPQDKQWTQTATIAKTYERACAENLGVSQHFIRQSCKEGRLKHNKAGTTVLIFYPNLIEFLKKGEDGAGASVEPVKDNVTEIKRIPEKFSRNPCVI